MENGHRKLFIKLWACVLFKNTIPFDPKTRALSITPPRNSDSCSKMALTWREKGVLWGFLCLVKYQWPYHSLLTTEKKFNTIVATWSLSISFLVLSAVITTIFMFRIKKRYGWFRIIIRFWETAHLPLPSANINAYLSLLAKCWLRGGGGGQFPRKV